MKTMETTSGVPAVVLPGPPRRELLWLWYQIPPLRYRLHLGWLMGHHSLLLTHRGRKTGRVRRTALDVLRFDPRTKECLVVSVYGERSDCFRNLMAHPALQVLRSAAPYNEGQPQGADLARLSNRSASQSCWSGTAVGGTRPHAASVT